MPQANTDKPHAKELRTPAWLLNGVFFSTPGELSLHKGKIAFASEGQTIFEASLAEVLDVRFPWHYFGAGCTFRIGFKSYRISFVEPGDQGSIVDGRSAGSVWRTVFET